MKSGLIVILLTLMLLLPKEVFSAETGTITITVTLAEVEIIQAKVEFRPYFIRPGRRYIRCYIELPAGYRVKDIDVKTVALTEVNGNPIEPYLKTVGRRRPRIGDFDRDGILDLQVWFDIRMIIPLLKSGENTLTITGNLIDGKKFEGTGTIGFIATSR